MPPVSSSYHDEFPLLRSNGLYASDISGDGDCLFHALSDQLYGHENNHTEIRARVVNHMREYSSYFKLFLDVEAVSGNPLGTRSSKRRAGGGGGSASEKYVPASEAVVNQAFENHLNRMSKSGVYGDNMEISAFTREYDCDVKIYQRDFAYVVTGSGFEDSPSKPGASPRKLLHIAYHTWEHYSSIRNTAGPHTGLPNVNPVPTTEEGRKEAERKSKETSYALPWMIRTVTQSLPYLASEDKIKKALEECKGNVNVAVDRLLDEEYAADGEGSPANSGAGEKAKVDVDEGIVADIEDEQKGDKKRAVSALSTDDQAEGEPTSADATSTEQASEQDGQSRKQAKKAGRGGKGEKGEPQNNRPVGNSGDEKDSEAQKGNSNTTTSTTSGRADEKSRKQAPKKPKRETARERKEKQKQAARERKKGAASTSSVVGDAPSPAMSSGIRELYI